MDEEVNVRPYIDWQEATSRLQIRALYLLDSETEEQMLSGTGSTEGEVTFYQVRLLQLVALKKMVCRHKWPRTVFRVLII